MNLQGEAMGAARATMDDVAREAGVSLKSVSRVINDEPHVSARLRAQVEMAIARLGYVPDTAARSLAGARSFTIGLLFDNPSPNYTMKIIAGAYRACREHRYHLQIETLDALAGGKSAEHVERILRNSRTDGLVLTPPLSDDPDVMALLEARGIRYVRVAPFTAAERAPAVLIDDRAAASEIADLLWRKGHRRFGFVGGPQDHGAALLRREGFCSRLRELDASAQIAEAFGGFTFEGGMTAGATLLAADMPPTAIFAANDDSAAGVMVACSRAGLIVPDDVSVAGFDDSWVAQAVWPYLTTIHQPIEAMGYAAVELLLDRRAAGGAEPLAVKLGYNLIVRDSVGDAR